MPVRKRPPHLKDPRRWLAQYEASLDKLKPAEYCVEYADNEEYRRLLVREARRPDFDPKYAHDAIDMAQYHDHQDCRSLDDVRLVIEALRALPEVTDVPGYEGTLPAADVYDVRHRVRIEDVTPRGDPPGLLWDFDDDYDWQKPEWLREMLA
jgi:hypothetical protein